MAEPVRSDEYGTRPNRRQVERARLERQAQAGDRTPANINDAPNTTIRNTNVVRFGEVRDISTAKKDPNQIFNPDTATTFNESYTRAGIQPSNINTEPKKTNTQTSTENIRQSTVQYFEPEEDIEEDEPVTTPLPVVKKKKKANAVKREIARAKATGVNLLALSIAGTLFIAQAALAIFTILFMAFAYMLGYFESTATQDDAGFWGGIINGVTQFFTSAYNYALAMIASLFGVEFDPTILFWVAYGATVAIGWFILLIMLLMYTIGFVKCLSGEAATLKKGMFLLAVIGHAIPGANILPWFMGWAIVVWLYPK